MGLVLNFRNIIDTPMWKPLANALGNSGAGTSLCFDPRDYSRNPYVWLLASTSALYAYHTMNDEWLQCANPGLSGVAAGTCTVFHGSGPSGNIAAGATTSSFALSTALSASVGVNSMGNRGDGKGFAVRVVNKVAGTIEKRRVVGNTGGTTPTVYLDTPLTNAPNLNDTYEFLSGRIYMLGSGVIGTSTFKYYDLLTNSVSTGLATTNLPGTIGTDSTMVALCEHYTPWDLDGDDGFLGSIVATGTTTATTITGSTAGADSTIVANEFRNFQVRIVNDPVNKSAVGQRARITSHTAGPSAVFTVASWPGGTPSSSATFVVENDNDKILLWSSASTTTFNYNISGNTWDTSTWAARGSAVGAGCTANQAYGMHRLALDPQGNTRNSYIWSTRGGGSTAIDLFDIAGGSTGAWTNAPTYGMSSTTFTTGTCAAYDPNTNNGRWIYFNQSGGQRQHRFDVINRVLEPWCYMPYAVGSGTIAVSERLAMGLYMDDENDASKPRVGFLITHRMLASDFFACILQR